MESEPEMPKPIIDLLAALEKSIADAREARKAREEARGE